ncbi:TPR-like protein [Pholiota conissans]|uniref:TPR-like protein n=1 Tax=Pholiota conissans TaxID=109636 RepID=A0A9P6CY66_9AGAR|nr:TPR-like protein [Pholiota conissans]
MYPEPLPTFFPYLSQRFQSLIWACLDADLTKTAVFHAERYFAMDRTNHESRHLYATALLREGQTYSALHLVNGPIDEQCTGCLEIKSRCCTMLGRHRQARDALEATLRDSNYVSSASSSSRISKPFPEEAALRCRSGSTALKGNLTEKASRSFRDALALNPYLWEAFEGLCALGTAPDIDELFPPRPAPTKRLPPEDIPQKSAPVASGAGFFTPDAGNSGNVFRTWKPEMNHPQPFRMVPPPGPRDSIATNDSFYPDNSFQAHRTSRSQPGNLTAIPNVSRPLSSADEAGPATKKLRPTVSQPDVLKAMKSKSSSDDPLKKARARPALSFANIFSSSGRRSQSTTSSRANLLHGKSNTQSTAHVATRRSSRLIGGTTVTSKPTYTSKHTLRDRRTRQTAHSRNRSTESDKDEGALLTGEVAYPPSPPSAALTPRSEVSPSPSTWTSAQEQLAQEEFESEQAEHYLYELVRRFARAARALSLYECKECLDELEQLPHVHQHSCTVIAMVGRAHYEQQDFPSAERAFKTLRKEEPYRLWDMEVYSSLLWQLQRSVELSFLAQELLSINPQSPQAWITIGNLFSLQKERQQALTCFRRAVQLDPTCAYAYTLSGHESIDEDVEKAINFFQTALRADARHYNAWYGLGTCYLRMSKVRLAEYHFRKAGEIHPKNAVLLGCIGMAVERRGNRDEALDLFNSAVSLCPENALVRYRRAKIYIAMRKYYKAVEDLEYLRSATPEESNVVFQLAKAYRLLGNVVKAQQLIAAARDMAPKSMSKIKKLLNTVKDEGGDEMDEG